jgi:DNA-directed RNA polymerase subunit beta'
LNIAEANSESSIYKVRNNFSEKGFVRSFFKKRSYLPVLSMEIENALTKPWFKQKTGSDFLKLVLENLNIKEEINEIRKTVHIAFANGVKKTYLINFDTKLKFLLQKLRVMESFLATKINPGNIILTNLPILPPTLRPFFESDNGTLVSSDINSSYRLIITQNNNLATQLFGIGFLSFLVTEMKRKLQEVVDNLIEASQNKSMIPGVNDQKPLKGLLDILEGKYGHFRQYLLGKRVDYSARSVIVSGPGLRFNQCGLPYDILTKLFQPQLIKKLLLLGNALDLQLSLIAIKLKKPFIFTLLKKITKSQKILLNRAPTLHKYGIQSFEILIILNKAIHLHPLVCGGFNADFDGDQMGVHLPLYQTTQLEVSQLMKPSTNFFSLANSEALIKPTQDMVMGCYYLTYQESKQVIKNLKCFSTDDEAIFAFHQKLISLHSPILIKKKIEKFPFFIENNNLFISDTFLKKKKKKVDIYKIYKSKSFYKKVFLLTNIGILILEYDLKNSYKMVSFFSQTTVGRIFFSKNFEKILQEF